MEDGPDLLFTTLYLPLPLTSIRQRTEEIRLRINGRCRGLLEVNSRIGDVDSVDFLHRTVKDFLMATETRQTLISWQREDFNLHLAVLGASLAEYKVLRSDMVVEKAISVRNMFLAAMETEKEKQITYFDYLRCLEPIFPTYQDLWMLQGSKHSTVISLPKTFLHGVITYNLTEYVRERHSEGLIAPQDTLKWACEIRVHQYGGFSTTEMISILLSAGTSIRFDQDVQVGLDQIIREDLKANALCHPLLDTILNLMNSEYADPRTLLEVVWAGRITKKELQERISQLRKQWQEERKERNKRLRQARAQLQEGKKESRERRKNVSLLRVTIGLCLRGTPAWDSQ